MENNNFNPEVEEQAPDNSSSLHKVTPLSKYLALTLFIVLPFLGGWVGYTYAPIKVVEVERLIVKDASTDALLISETARQHEQIEQPTVSSGSEQDEGTSEQTLCAELTEIDDILGSFDTNREFWNRLIFEVRDAGCSKETFESGNSLYTMTAGCGYCFVQIYKDPSGYQQLHPFSKNFGNQIVTVNDRSVESLDTNTSQSSIILELASEQVNKTFFAGEDQSSNITYDEVTTTISISVHDKNTCKVGHGGCYYTEIPSDLKTVKLP